MLDLAADFGWSISQLNNNLSLIEIRFHLIRRMVAAGYTFDPEKIEEIKRLKKQESREKFLNKARESW